MPSLRECCRTSHQASPCQILFQDPEGNPATSEYSSYHIRDLSYVLSSHDVILSSDLLNSVMLETLPLERSHSRKEP